VLFEPSDRPLDHVAVPVANRIDLGWSATSGPPAAAGSLLVGPLGDGVGDPALT
jgi:hypothetical protein